MCTVSWWRRNGSLSLRFNRDEQKTRAPAEPPARKHGLLYPTDPQSGGTWICVDPCGTVHCLLNYYDAQDMLLPKHPRSRGELPLLSAGSSAPFRKWLDPCPYPPFHLLRIPQVAHISHITWDGRQLSDGPEHPDLCHWSTSGWNAADVVPSRNQLFTELIKTDGLSEQTLHRFHYSAHPRNSGFWPLMNRENAQTVSISEIKVDEHRIFFSYQQRTGNTLLPPHESTYPR